MSSLAALFSQPPPSFHNWKNSISHLSLSLAATKYLWNGLSEETRVVYESAKRSYEFYCAYFGISPWPAQEHALAEWASARADSSSQIKFQGKVKPKTILSMVSALRSVHVDRRFPTKPESEWLKKILAGISRCHPSDNTKKAEPMSRLATRIVCVYKDLLFCPKVAPLLESKEDSFHFMGIDIEVRFRRWKRNSQIVLWNNQLN